MASQYVMGGHGGSGIRKNSKNKGFLYVHRAGGYAKTIGGIPCLKKISPQKS
jgi:hypothetical protein